VSAGIAEALQALNLQCSRPGEGIRGRHCHPWGGATLGPGLACFSAQKAPVEQASPAGAGDHRRAVGWAETPFRINAILPSWRPMRAANSALRPLPAGPSDGRHHRALRPKPSTGCLEVPTTAAFGFKRNAELPAGVRSAGVDETSMVDISAVDGLLLGRPPTMRRPLLLVGVVGSAASVGPAKVWPI